MTESLAVLSATALISFIGSIHPGPVNLAVIHATLTRNFRVGILVAVSGVLPEIIYTTIALKSHEYLIKNPSTLAFLEVSVVPFFLIIGIVSFFKKRTSTALKTTKTQRKEVFNGFISGFLNPQLLPFWVVVLVYLNSFYKLDSFSTKFSFVVGAALGAFLILYFFAYLTNRFHAKIFGVINRYSIDKMIGSFFIGMSLFQSIKILL